MFDLGMPLRMGGRLRALMSLPALALASSWPPPPISGQLTGLNACGTGLAWPALAVAATWCAWPSA
jgi:hypothetical protein